MWEHQFYSVTASRPNTAQKECHCLGGVTGHLDGGDKFSSDLYGHRYKYVADTAAASARSCYSKFVLHCAATYSHISELVIQLRKHIWAHVMKKCTILCIILLLSSWFMLCERRTAYGVGCGRS